MLRITLQQTQERVVVKLEGRLSLPWVREADACWRAAGAVHTGRTIEIDLRDVWGVDDAGRELLRRMHHAGAVLTVRGCAMRELVREVEGSAGDELPGTEGRRT